MSDDLTNWLSKIDCLLDEYETACIIYGAAEYVFNTDKLQAARKAVMKVISEAPSE